MAMLSDNEGGSFGADENPKPPAQAVEDFHTNSDSDARAESQHHTLGPSPSQASPGDHTHDGGDSALILRVRLLVVLGLRMLGVFRLMLFLFVSELRIIPLPDAC
jgi:hypothetical protein